MAVLEQIADGKVHHLVRDPQSDAVRGVRAPSFADRISAIAELGRIGTGPPCRMEVSFYGTERHSVVTAVPWARSWARINMGCALAR
jgi:hypothetical protein